MESFPTMDITSSPSGHEWCMTGKITIGSNDLVGSTDKDCIVNRRGFRRTEYGLVFHLIIIYYRIVTSGEFCIECMLSFLQMNDGRSRWRKPCVLQVDNRFPIYLQMMSTGHLLSYIQQQGIITLLIHINRCLEHISLAHLSPCSFCRGYVHHLPIAFSFLFCQSHMLVARIELCQSVVVPQQAIALTGKHHGNRYLRVHLRQSTGKSADITIPILELSESVKTFVLR